MTRILSFRSVYDTTSNSPRWDIPISMNRFSDSEWSGSKMVIERVSRRTVVASSKDTPWCFRLLLAFFGSHSNSSAISRTLQYAKYLVHRHNDTAVQRRTREPRTSGFECGVRRRPGTRCPKGLAIPLPRLLSFFWIASLPRSDGGLLRELARLEDT